MATSPRSFNVSVRDTSGAPQVFSVTSTTTVGRIKQIFADRTGIDPNQYRLVFAGQQLDEDSTLETFGVMGHSTLHCIKGRPRIMVDVTRMHSIQNVEDKLADVDLPPTEDGVGQRTTSQEDRASSRNRFYVYCKDSCKSMKPGKLRVRCNLCKDESFILSRGPDNWDDVLIKSRINGTCNTENCRGRFAEFFFKCGGHESIPGQHEQCIALHMIRANTVEVPCASCADASDVVVRFDCNHCMCVDCFIQYCTVNLTSRSFKELTDIGYTLQCPDKCDGSYIREIHHFQLMGKELYERYKNFGAEEFVLQMGGVLCPAVNCGAGILLEDRGRRVQCPTCRHVFCKDCKSNYHTGNCTEALHEPAAANQGPAYDQERLQRARWNEESERFISEAEDIKRCPQCNFQIQKSAGCNHMTCRCGYEFCWLCLIAWNNNCQGSHWFRR